LRNVLIRRNRIMPGHELPADGPKSRDIGDFSARRRGVLAVFVLVLAFVAVGCGGGGEEPPSEGEKADDIAILNTALGYELTVVDAYGRALPLLRGETLAVAREFRAQEQEHINAIVKAIRGLGGRTDAESPDPSELGCNAYDSYRMSNALHPSVDDALALVYCQVSAAIAEDMSAVANLTASWPRALLTSIVANEAQQLAVLRQALGADPVPEAFENGEIPPPGAGGS
jgi:bacterioferritin (cytochrome b1)